MSDVTQGESIALDGEMQESKRSFHTLEFTTSNLARDVQDAQVSRSAWMRESDPGEID